MFGFVCDMDGVVYRGARAVPGAARFVKALQDSGRPYLFLTNNPDYTPEQLSARLGRIGMKVPASHFYTAAQATAAFIQSQTDRPRIYAIGERALLQELEAVGATLTERDPEYVVVGTTRTFNYDRLEKAINFVVGGAKLIGTNPDPQGPAETGLKPGCGALVAGIEIATGRKAYFIGKPNPLIMRSATRKMGIRASQAYMVGDRMDTDIIVGIEAGMKTILVLSGVARRADLKLFPYRPDYIFPSVADIPLNRLP